MKVALLVCGIICCFVAAGAAEPGYDVYVPGELVVKYRGIDTAAVERAVAAGGFVAATGNAGLDGLDSLNRKFGVRRAKPLFPRLPDSGGVRTRQGARIEERRAAMLRRDPGLESIYLLGISDGSADIEEVCEEYRNDPHVEYAEPNYIYRADATPNDPRFDELWGMHNTGQTGGTADADIDAPEAWDGETGSGAISVAVIDTGVDYAHEDLAANIWTNPGEIAGNGLDDDGNGYVDDVHGYDFRNDDGDPIDDHGHGTHCAGTIGAVGDNGIGVAGVCWNVKIMALKFLSSSGSGSSSDAVGCVLYATQMGAGITSNSWGGGAESQALKDAIDAAGSLFIAAAGNSADDNDADPFYPSSYDCDNIIAVAATDHDDDLASFSCYGATSVDVAAPGVDILSCLPGADYDTKSGTSMATPHVAGLAALVTSRNGGLGATEIKEIILETADPLPGLVGKVLSGGRINAFSSVRRADPHRGSVSLDCSYYLPDGSAAVAVYDDDLDLDPGRPDSATVTVTSDSEPGGETVTLTESGDSTGRFTGGIDLSEDDSAGVLRVSHGDTVTVEYIDADDGQGNVNVSVTDSAVVDGVPPVISGVTVSFDCDGLLVEWVTDEPSDTRVGYGADPEDLDNSYHDGNLVAGHSVTLVEGLSEGVNYLEVGSRDPAGNGAVDDNGGSLYGVSIAVTRSHYYVSLLGSDGGGDGSIGSPWLTIMNARYSAGSGDPFCVTSIHVAAGTYDEQVLIGNHMEILGGYDPLTWERDTAAHETVIVGADGDVAVIFYNDTATLDGFTVDGGEYGVYCYSGTPTVTNNILQNQVNDALYLYKCDGGTLSGNVITGSGDDGIYLKYAESMLISGNVIRGSGDYGIYNSRSFGTGITNNKIEGSADDGIQFYDCEGGTAKGNLVEGGDDDGITCRSSFVSVEGNTIRGAASDGIVWDCEETAPAIVNNVVTGCGMKGIKLYTDAFARIVDNTIADNGSGGIYLNSGASAEIVNCILWNNSDDLKNCAATYSCVSDRDIGEGNVFSDPLFMDSKAGDYRLGVGSPCIDAGAGIDIFEDFEGDARPVDGDGSGTAEHDIGADEYSSTISPTPLPSPTAPAPTPAPNQPSPTPTASVAAEVLLNGSVFAPGDFFRAVFRLNEPVERLFTAYAVLVLPGGEILDGSTLDTTLRPVVINKPGLDAPYEFLILETVVPAGAPAGDYEIFAALFDPDGEITGRDDAFLDVSAGFSVD